MVTLDGGLFSVLTRFVSTPSKEGIFYVGVSVAGTTKIGKKWLEGDIAEVIAFDRLVTDEERYKIESYLAAKYGITLIKSSSSNPVKVSGTPSYNYTYMSSTGETWWPANRPIMHRIAITSPVSCATMFGVDAIQIDRAHRLLFG